jgi:hypothetical protein
MRTDGLIALLTLALAFQWIVMTWRLIRSRAKTS